MPELLFRLNHVPEDEAEDIRDLLNAHGIDFYETSAGKWGFSVAAIWLRDEDMPYFEQARALIDDYQRQRVERVREEYRKQREQGMRPGLWRSIRSHPLRYLVVFALLAFMVYVSIVPFLGLAAG